jgi:predicted naringenin-chalcone synthase
MTAVIAGLATARPPRRASQETLAAITGPMSCATAEHDRLLPALYRRTTVTGRACVALNADEQSMFYPLSSDPGDDRGGSARSPQGFAGPTTAQRMTRYIAEAGPLAAEVGGKALRDAMMQPSRVTHLVTVTCTGFAAPGFDLHLVDALDLRRDVQRVQVGFMGCHGAINGLRTARAIALAEPDACVLLCAVELCSLHFQYGWNPQRIVANALFADGAAAMVVVGREAAPATSAGLTVTATGSCLFRDSADAMTWHIGDSGFEMTLSPRVPELISTNLRPWFEPWLAKQGLRIGDVAGWAIHPGGPRVMTAVGQALGLSEGALAASRQVLAGMGNMSSPTVLFILDELRGAQAAVGPCLLMGFGPGLAAEVALLTPQAG